jgi:hypothetical protein
MIYELPARRSTEEPSNAMTTRRLSELLAACLGAQQADQWAVSVIVRPRCRVLPFQRPDRAADYARVAEDDELAE